MNKIICCHCGEEMDISKTYCCMRDGKLIAEGHKHCVMIHCNKKQAEIPEEDNTPTFMNTAFELE